MRLPILIVLTLVLINTLVDIYLYKVIKKRTKSPVYPKMHVVISVLLFIFLIVGISIPRRSGSDDTLMSIMWILYSYLTLYIPKWFFLLLDLVASIPRLWHRRRWRVISWFGIGTGVITFVLMWWGALINRFNVDVEEVEVTISNLPSNFDGYRIAQISDLHVGSYDRDTTFIADVVNELNGQNVDAIVFTGDIVNRRSEELRPFVGTLSQMNATDGVYSIMGNHDYGDYHNWKTDDAKRENLEMMHEMQHEMGWRLLRNETQMLYRGNDSIALIGVENVGDPPFTVYGKLNKAYPTLGDSVIKVLLTHNPAHWEMGVKGKKDVKIDLTLSGHTHGMQVMLFGLSPAKWRYDLWGGRYDDDMGHTLYVNIGIGTVAIPARIGATPEITVFTLRRAK